MKTTLIVARHGNTFKKNEPPRRVGGKTDLPLVEEEKGKRLGLYLKKNNLLPDIIFSSPLLRTIQTANQAMEAMDITNSKLYIEESFREIDYGPDENKTEQEVEQRLGQIAIKHWNDKNIIPNGWKVYPETLIQNWKNFAQNIEKKHPHKTVLVVTSNGIARFSPHLTENFDPINYTSLKIATGALCIFEKELQEKYWKNTVWNHKP